ncbi:coagulation factor X-like [Leucoraja erinacea]|uniref:coagulation factor X-like n=1 Tax=Leucoraja erinaceus TaxID=7782 RepID=UPI0024541EA5|nr:coagulation factor X-like [Leucoraja erinacea]
MKLESFIGVLSTMLWLLGFVLPSLVPTEANQQVFLPSNAAQGLLSRQKRRNFLLEELRQGNLERECIEEQCNFEEAREVFENEEQTWEFYKTYMVASNITNNLCKSAPCWNGGTCHNTLSDYNCTCKTGYGGKTCEIENDMCASSPCKNGGWCSKEATHYKCSCETGYYGQNCEHGPQDCSSHGQSCDQFCKFRHYNYVCYCAQGYKLGKDKKSCVPAVPYPCGKLSVPLATDDSDLIIRAIIGDQLCQRGEYPWQVLVKNDDETVCGGAILNEDFVLTSAACVKHMQFSTVVLGEHNLEEEEGTEQVINISRTYIHSRYSQVTFENDIALLQLEMPIQFNNYTSPICLPEVDFAEFFLMNSEYGAISGWKLKQGRVEQPVMLGVPYVPYIKHASCEGVQSFPLVNRMFCAGFEELEDPLCSLIRGSPLVTSYKGVWFLTGLSLGADEYNCNKIPVYTKVSRYINWIKQIMRKKHTRH